MKKVWLLCICSCILTAGLAQERIRETVALDKNSGGNWENSWKAVYRYQGNTFEGRDGYRWHDQTWKLKNTDHYWRNEAGFLTRHISRIYTEDFSRVFFESILDIEYEADTLESSSRFVRTVFDENISVFRSETSNTYTANGLIETYSYRLKESPSAPWTGGGTRYTYDANQCISKILQLVVQDDEMVPYSGTRYEHDNQCREQKATNFTVVNGTEVEGSATYTTYQDDPGISRTVKYFREKPTSAWQFDKETEVRTAGDSSVHTFTNNELTFTVRRVEVFIKDLKVLETAEVAYDSPDQFYLTNISWFTYENGLLLTTEWEERSGDAGNRITGEGSVVYTYNQDGKITRYSSTSVRNGVTSTYSQRYAYRCDGLRELVESDDSRIITSYYHDAPCDGPDFEAAMSLYPNPARNDLWVYSELNMAGAQVEVVDLTGKILVSMKAEGPSYAYLDISGLAPGMYMVRILGDGIRSTRRFIKSD